MVLAPFVQGSSNMEHSKQMQDFFADPEGEVTKAIKFFKQAPTGQYDEIAVVALTTFKLRMKETWDLLKDVKE